jgi:hypothetical protein
LTRPRLFNMYGITETTVHASWHELRTEDLAAETGNIGTALPDLCLRLLDPCGRDLPVGVPGEIHVGGAGVGVGYHARPELTAARFVHLAGPDGETQRYYRSGDLARYRADGGLDYLGRIDQQVKLRGFRIELGEIESTLAAHPGVAQASVLCRGGGPDAVLCAYVVPRTAADLALPDAFVDALRKNLAAALPEYMRPGPMWVLAELPVTINGKIDRARLPAPSAGAQVRRAPSGEFERAVADIWAEVLGGPVEDAEASFFELGGQDRRGRPRRAHGHSGARPRAACRRRAIDCGPAAALVSVPGPAPERGLPHRLRARTGRGTRPGPRLCGIPRRGAAP